MKRINSINKFDLKCFGVSLLLLLWTILRNGIRIQGPGELGLKAAEAFPKASYYVSESFGPLLIAKLFGLDTAFKWSTVYLVSTLLLIFCAYFWSIKHFNSVGLVVILFFSVSPYSINLLNQIGHYDLFTISGWLIYFYALQKKKRTLNIIGLLVAISGNPEQALLSTVSLYILSTIEGDEVTKKKFRNDLVIALCLFILIQFWLIYFGAGGRVLLVVLYFVKSTSYFLINFPNSVTSLYGIFWLPIIYYIFTLNFKTHKIKAVLSLILIPMIATALAVDGTRIFSCISLPMLLFLIYSKKYEAILRIVSSKKISLNLIISFCIFFPFTYILVGYSYEPYSFLRDDFLKIEKSYDALLLDFARNLYHLAKDWPILDRFFSKY